MDDYLLILLSGYGGQQAVSSHSCSLPLATVTQCIDYSFEAESSSQSPATYDDRSRASSPKVKRYNSRRIHQAVVGNRTIIYCVTSDI